MWGQIERFAKAAAKRSDGIDEFVNQFKRKMACTTINPYWMGQDIKAANAYAADGEITILGSPGIRGFGLEIFEDNGNSRDIIDCIYEKTQIVILLVRDRLEREKIFAKEAGPGED